MNIKTKILTFGLVLYSSFFALANNPGESNLSSYQSKNVISQRVVYMSNIWRKGNIEHNYAYFNGRVVPCIILKRGSSIQGYALFHPYKLRPFVVLGREVKLNLVY